jgi:hypothetical protein
MYKLKQTGCTDLSGMKDSYLIDLIDFHHGWLIEIIVLETVSSENKFKAVCYSPYRKHLILQELHCSKFDALFAAQQMINYQIACNSLSCTLRELYEAGQLHFDEWNSLQHSLRTETKTN